MAVAVAVALTELLSRFKSTGGAPESLVGKVLDLQGTKGRKDGYLLMFSIYSPPCSSFGSFGSCIPSSQQDGLALYACRVEGPRRASLAVEGSTNSSHPRPTHNPCPLDASAGCCLMCNAHGFEGMRSNSAE